MAIEWISTGQLFNGEPVNGADINPAMLEAWSDADLAAAGLQRRVEPPPPQPTLAEAQAIRIEALKAEHNTRFASSAVTVLVNGVNRTYGCDPDTRENVVAIVGAITASPSSVPDPRPFTPQGGLQPIATTHAEFIAIYLAGLVQGDTFYIAYATHKAALMALADVASVLNYDITTGWPQ